MSAISGVEPDVTFFIFQLYVIYRRDLYALGNNLQKVYIEF